MQIFSQEKVSKSNNTVTQIFTIGCIIYRGEFIEYLQRPDHKQELLSQWQSDFNSLPIHLHREATMKAELHCKIDVYTYQCNTVGTITNQISSQDLCDKLWDICDVRKTEWEAEHNRIMTEHWLEDHLGLITNTYISLMQVYLYYTYNYQR